MVGGMPFYVNAAIGLVWVLVCFRMGLRISIGNADIPPKKGIYPAGCRHSRNIILIPLQCHFKNRNLWALMLMYFCCQGANYFFIGLDGRVFAGRKHFLKMK